MAFNPLTMAADPRPFNEWLPLDRLLPAKGSFGNYGEEFHLLAMSRGDHLSDDSTIAETSRTHITQRCDCSDH